MTPRALLTAAAACLALLTGCSGTPAATTAGTAGTATPTAAPAAADLLSRSAEAMKQVKTVGVDVQVDPTLRAVPVRAATASLTAAGDAVGSATPAHGAPVEFVVVGGRVYLTGPTGGFGPPIPISVAAGFYDPTAVLDPQRGVARLLATATPGATQAEETVDGVDTHRVPATFGADAVAALVPGVRTPVSGVLWIDAVTSRLVKAELQVPGGPGGATGPVTVRLHDYDAPVTVTAPA